MSSQYQCYKAFFLIFLSLVFLRFRIHSFHFNQIWKNWYHLKLFQKFEIHFNQSHQDMLKTTCVTKWHDRRRHPAQPLNLKLDGHYVWRASNCLPDLSNMSGKIGKCPKCLFILDFFQNSSFRRLVQVLEIPG